MVYVNDKLEIAVRAAGRTIPLESLSQGTVEQAWLALRLAAIDIAFPQGGMPLLLDDCFLAYDDERLSHTLLWLAENYSGQVFLFTCQKREAALLETFLRRIGQSLSRSLLLLKVWGPDSDVEEGNLDNYIHFLRRRLNLVGSNLEIKTIRGIGYCLQDRSASS